MAYSGGIDSHVLLCWLAGQRPLAENRSVSAVHVNHGLHSEAPHWSEHCRVICEQLDIPLRILTVDARPQPGESPEAAARHARYSALQSQLQPDTAVLTAHHQDDQAETLLLQLLRGSGPSGLAAMPMAARLGRGWLWRPLLEIPRAEIADYAQSHGLQWIDDTSNADRRPDRNFLRHDILPLLKSRWPASARTLARSARLCGEAAELLDTLATADLHPTRCEDDTGCLLIPALQELDEPRLRNVLRHWLRDLHLPPPTAVQLARIVHEVIAAPSDRRPLVHWPGCEVRRYRQRLYAMTPRPPPVLDSHYPLHLSDGECHIPGIGRLRWRRQAGQGLDPDKLNGRALSIRFRHGGECLRPVGRKQVHSLKKLWQEAGVPPWERDRFPLLYADEALVAVVDGWIAAEFAVRPEAIGWILELNRQCTN